MVELVTLAVLLGPPALGTAGLYLYYRAKRRKGKRSARLRSMMFNVVLSFLSGQRMSVVISRSDSFEIPADDTLILGGFKQTVESLPFLDLIPLEFRLTIVLIILIWIILLPGP